jgi:hypothetical protein
LDGDRALEEVIGDARSFVRETREHHHEP